MTMAVTDVNQARILAHQNNIARYRLILATRLTDLERSFVVKRLAEEKLSLRTLIRSSGEAISRSCEAQERAA